MNAANATLTISPKTDATPRNQAPDVRPQNAFCAVSSRLTLSTSRRVLKWAALAGLAFSGLNAHAALDAEDLMTMAWEELWNQSGSPAPLRKWHQPLKIRISGDPDSLQKKVINATIKDMSEVTGLEHTLLAADDTTENILIEIVSDSPKLAPTTPCVTQMSWDNIGMKKATIIAKNTYYSQCLLHEFGHAIGIEGHPYGRTIMTYFNPRLELTDYDKFIISSRYRPELKHNASPFRVLKFIGERYVSSLESEAEKTAARHQVGAFMASIANSMTLYAENKGEAPTVLYRSGRSSLASMEAGRVMIQFFLGEAFLEGDLGRVDMEKGRYFLEMAAANKSLPAAWSLAARYLRGKDFRRDTITAYAWFSFAAALGHLPAQELQQKIAKTVSPADLLAHEKAAADLLEKAGLQAAKPEPESAQ